MALVHKKELVSAHVIAVIAVLASIPIPLLIPLLIDEVLLNKPGKVVAMVGKYFPESLHSPFLYIIVLTVICILLRLTYLSLNVWQTKKFVSIAKDIIYRIRYQLLNRLKSVTMSEYETLGGGAVSSKFVTDLNTVDQFAGETVSKFLVAGLTIVGVAGVLIWLHWQLALFIMFVNPLVIYITMLIGKKVKELKKKENKSFEKFQQSLTETLDGIQQIRASNREGYYLDRVKKNAKELKEHSAAFSWKSDAANRLSFSVFLIGFDIFRALSMAMVLLTDLSIGEMIAVFGYLWFMMGPVQEVLSIQYSFYSAKAALGRINELLHLPREPEFPHIENPFTDKHAVSVQIEDIKFAYGDGPYVLDGVNLAIQAGEKVALVGASGGGKSTLVQVLLGLYPPLFGEIKFDQVPVSRIGMEVVREHVACVLQHPALFNDTVRMNLTLGREVPDAALWRVLEVAQIKDVIEAMPRGLDSLIGVDGIRLSGGQRQRIAIARMALTNPQVVILDEATSALDAETEAKLHIALAEFLKGRTMIIVAHRLSAVKQADTVYVFEDGKITEQGGHKELLIANGLYAKLYGQHQTA
ncbi:MAG: ABC transporter ATP-binding protein/permease [Gammaproteobacteria bacterium]|nr:ABC transporter ATP-binding protein/permease [Gammaproteobacteria bacterium]NNC68984.1 ABC transporter ATP-binding protein [Gammaproteobacteria bacterium]